MVVLPREFVRGPWCGLPFVTILLQVCLDAPKRELLLRTHGRQPNDHAGRRSDNNARCRWCALGVERQQRGKHPSDCAYRRSTCHRACHHGCHSRRSLGHRKVSLLSDDGGCDSAATSASKRLLFERHSIFACRPPIAGTIGAAEVREILEACCDRNLAD